jgi:uncharacterized membrane protein YsdA (DUF1294 family)
MEFLYAYLIVINAIGCLIMLADKRKASKKARRIPETTLMGIAAMGGSLGCLIGMYTLRHKTRHLKFTLGVPLLLILQILLLQKIL